MDAAHRSQLLQILHSRCGEIADRWHQAVAHVHFAPPSAVEVRQHLLELTEQVATLLLSEPFEPDEARAIGAAMAGLSSHPEALGRAQQVLMREFLKGLSGEQAAALQPRLTALLGGLATGYVQQVRDSILAEHEQIERALGAELRRSGLALRESEAQAWALLNTPPDSALLIDLDGAIVALNEAAAKALGGSPDELIGLCVFDLFPPDVAERRKAHCDQVVRSDQPVRFEDQREGRWLDSSLYPILDAQGKVVQLAVFARDVTERKRVEQALRESEAQAWALLNAPSDSVLLLDPDGTIVSLNEVAAKRLGRSRDELLGTCAFDLFPPEVAQHRRAQGERVISSSQPIRFEDERGGRWFDQHVYPVLDAEGRVMQLALFAHDITERKRMENALRESELRYRTFFENVPVGVGLATLDGRIVECNDALLGMMGWSRAELGQVTLRDAYKDLEDRAQLLSGLRTDGGVRDFEVELKRKDGTFYWANLTVASLHMGGQEFYLAAVQDITEHKQMERHMLLAERLAAVGRFATGLAHEINNPLQAVRTNLELALDFGVGPDERERCLRIVRQEIERLTQTTRRVLDFAQPADDTRYPWSIAGLVERTLALVDGQLRRAHVRVTSDIPDDLPPVFVAPDQIVQVLLNLTINAIEAMPDGGHMQVKARVDGHMLSLDVCNDGPPIPSEYIDRVFDAFFTTKPKGTGLGLPISYSIVQRHGGTIRVENQGDGGGVMFTVTLPVARIPGRQEEPA